MAKIAVNNVSILIMEKSVTENVYAKQSIATILKDVKLVSILSLKLKKNHDTWNTYCILKVECFLR